MKSEKTHSHEPKGQRPPPSSPLAWVLWLIAIIALSLVMTGCTGWLTMAVHSQRDIDIDNNRSHARDIDGQLGLGGTVAWTVPLGITSPRVRPMGPIHESARGGPGPENPGLASAQGSPHPEQVVQKPEADIFSQLFSERPEDAREMPWWGLGLLLAACAAAVVMWVVKGMPGLRRGPPAG